MVDTRDDSSDSSDNSVVHPKEVETVMYIYTVYTVRTVGRYVQTLSLRCCVMITLQVNAVFRTGLVN